MQAMDDMALLREYATRNSEAAFAELVSRRAAFVYSAALRQVRDPHLAEEITQAVFIILAQKAGRISERAILTGWLFKTTRYTTLAQMRTAAKRQRREQEAQMQSELQPTAPNPFWEQMSPMLDEALASLGEKDRQAVLLRFFENKSLAEVGNNLGTGEDTARKRVTRALEKLHRYFSKRGVSSTTAIIAGVLAANSAQAAPVALAKSVAAVAIAKGAAASGSTLILIKGALKIMAWTKAKTAVMVGVGVLLAAGTTTVTVKTFVASRIDRYLSDPELTKYLEAPPLLVIQPTHFPNTQFPTAGGSVGDKIVGRNLRLQYMLADAYGFPQTRIVFSNALPIDRFDYLVTITNRPGEKFQAAIKQKLHWAGRRETREMDALLLRVKHPGAPNLKISTNFWPSASDPDQILDWPHERISSLASMLESNFRKPVIDQTGLTNFYDITLKGKWPEKWQENRQANLEFFGRALTEQLGLELVPSREPIEMLVVQKVK